MCWSRGVAARCGSWDCIERRAGPENSAAPGSWGVPKGWWIEGNRHSSEISSGQPLRKNASVSCV